MKKNLYYSVALVASLFVNTAFAQTFVSNMIGANETPAPLDTPMGGLAVALVTVNDDGSFFGCAQCYVQGRPLLSRVDLLPSKHGTNPRLQA